MGRKRINTPVNESLPDNTRILSNGAVYDMTQKKIVAMRPELAIKDTQITTQNASALQARQQERKREIMLAAANDAVQRGDYKQKFGSDAWIAAVTETQFIKATTPDDPKSTDAARFLFKETGLAAGDASEQVDLLGGLAELVRELAAFARAMPNVQPPADVIDAE